MTVRSLLNFIVGLVRDPVTKDLSSTRVLALFCTLMACVVAWKHAPTPAVAAVVTAFVGGGAVALLTRKQSGGGGDA